ncbi:hypothetical protein [Bowmanella dokdonensis]|nr:hypothetical protein [Bowmanella dokdonensis]
MLSRLYKLLLLLALLLLVIAGLAYHSDQPVTTAKPAPRISLGR